ncbi:MAG: hypothetical protein IMZ71_02035 [Chloroflexi bacterium]|nr:hypothetical protein [Chloroflexota bacterium]
MSAFIRTAIMQFMQGHVGRANAIRKRRIIASLAHYGVTDDQERRVRDLLASLPLCTCQDGWFTPNYKNIPVGTAEVLEFKRFLTTGAGGPITASVRCSIIYSIYPMLIPPAEQGKFNFEEARP